MSRKYWLHIPNLLTLGRIFSVPVLVWLILIHELNWAFWLLIGAGISDGLDGFLAKRMNAQTKIGAFLDPLADKFLVVSLFIVLGVQELLPIWLVIMVVFRDFAIVAGASLIEVVTHDLKMSPNFISKVNTTFQILLVSFVLGVHGLAITSAELWVDGFIVVTAATTALSGMIYLYQWGATIGQLNGET